MATRSQAVLGRPIRRSDMSLPKDAVELALPGHPHRPLEGVTRPQRGAGVGC